MKENNLETPSEGATNSNAYTHLGQQSCNGNPNHPCPRENRFKLSTVEAVVPRFTQDQLARPWRHLRMDEPARRLRLVKRPWGSVILQVDDQRSRGPGYCQNLNEAIYKRSSAGNSRRANQQTLLRINQ